MSILTALSAYWEALMSEFLSYRKKKGGMWYLVVDGSSEYWTKDYPNNLSKTKYIEKIENWQ